MSVPDPNIAPDPMIQVMAAARDPSVPKMYGAQFNIVLGVHDITMLFASQGAPTGMITITYPCAKTLFAQLGEAIGTYETAVGVPVIDAATLELKLKTYTAAQVGK